MAVLKQVSLDRETIKIRWNEPFGSAAVNKKLYGILPQGIYSGFNLSASGGNAVISPTGVSQKNVTATPESCAIVYTRDTNVALTVTTSEPITVDLSDIGSGAVSVSTFAGTGTFGSVDGASAQFSLTGIAKDSSGNIYIADRLNHKIRKITPQGVTSTFSGTGVAGLRNGPFGIGPQFNYPTDVAVDTFGNVYVSDEGNNQIRKITSSGTVTTFAGSSVGASGYQDASGTSALFESPTRLTIDSGNNLYVVDGTSRIRKITPSGVVSTFAENAGRIEGIAVDSSGSVYASIGERFYILRITTEGDRSFFAGFPDSSGSVDGLGYNARFEFPNGLTFDSSGNLYVVDLNKIRKVDPVGNVTTVAGSAAGFADGTSAQFSSPNALVMSVDEAAIYVADTENFRIRKVNLPSAITAYLVIDAEYAVSNETTASVKVLDSSESRAGYCVIGSVQVYGSVVSNASEAERSSPVLLEDSTMPAGFMPQSVWTSFLKLDGLSAMQADLNMGSFKITSLSTPSSASDASTKGYVDSAVSGANSYTDTQFSGLRAVSSVSSSTILTNSNSIVLATAGVGGITVTLPSPSAGRVFHIKKIDSAAGVVTITPPGSAKIDGASTKVLTYQYDCLSITSDGTNFFVI